MTDLTPAAQSPPPRPDQKAVPDLTAEELRLEAARIIRSLANARRIITDLEQRGQEVQNRLLAGPENLKLGRAEGARTGLGTVTVEVTRKGRAWANKEELTKDAGELGDLAPKPDNKVTIKLLSKLPTAIAAELRGLAAREDGAVEMADATKYPTVAELRKAFGEDTKYVGVPAAERSVVLVLEDGTTLGLDGVREVKA